MGHLPLWTPTVKSRRKAFGSNGCCSGIELGVSLPCHAYITNMIRANKKKPIYAKVCFNFRRSGDSINRRSSSGVVWVHPFSRRLRNTSSSVLLIASSYLPFHGRASPSRTLHRYRRITYHLRRNPPPRCRSEGLVGASKSVDAAVVTTVGNYLLCRLDNLF